MRTFFVCFLLLIGVLVMEAKSISLNKGYKTDLEDLEETIQDLRKKEMNLNRGTANDNFQKKVDALTEEESDPASGTGEVNPEDY